MEIDNYNQEYLPIMDIENLKDYYNPIFNEYKPINVEIPDIKSHIVTTKVSTIQPTRSITITKKEKSDQVENPIIEVEEEQPQQKEEQPKNQQLDSSVIDQIINTARKYVGGKYVSGRQKPESGGFDCSGLLYYAFNTNGVKLPATTHDIFKAGQEVSSLSQVQPGDIICTPGHGFTKKHVKMVSKIENGQIYVVEAKGRKYGIVEGPLKKTNNIITIRRIVQPKSANHGTKLIRKCNKINGKQRFRK